MVFPLDRHLKLKWETDDVVRFDKHFRVWKTEFLWSPGGLKFSKCNVWKTRCIYNRRSARFIIRSPTHFESIEFLKGDKHMFSDHRNAFKNETYDSHVQKNTGC